MEDIIFKSTPENFRKEYLGLKKNTARIKDDNTDLRFAILDDFIEGNICILEIAIINSKSFEEFTRLVTDVTKFEDIYIISWN